MTAGETGTTEEPGAAQEAIGQTSTATTNNHNQTTTVQVSSVNIGNRFVRKKFNLSLSSTELSQPFNEKYPSDQLHQSQLQPPVSVIPTSVASI